LNVDISLSPINVVPFVLGSDGGVLIFNNPPVPANP
jgi:hypothetical protein